MNQETNIVGLDGNKIASKKNQRKYPIIWNAQVSKRGWTEEELKEEKWGACDQIIVFAIHVNKDGSRNDLITSVDGVNPGKGDAPNTLPPLELFKAWATMAAMLKDDDRLGMGLRAIAGGAFRAIQKVLALRGQFGKRSEA